MVSFAPRRIASAGSALVLSVVILLCLVPNRVAAESSFVPGDLIIQMASGKDASTLTDTFADINLTPVKLLSRRMNIWLVRYNTGQLKAADHQQVLDRVQLDPDVEFGQFNHYIEMRQTFPDDPGFSNQWGIHNTGQTGGTADADIDAPEAWDLTTSGLIAQCDPIVVAVVDGGCDLNHPDIDYFKNTNEVPGNGIDDDSNGYIDDYDGWDAYDSDGSVPGNDHGTHVAGIGAAIGNNTAGVTGVNWNVKVLPIAGSTGQEAIAVEAYGYALEMRARYNETDGAYGAFVVVTNSSFGVDYGDPANYPIWCAMYDSMGAYGILSAAATANIGMDIDVEGDVPTACPSRYLLSVTNTTDDDARNSGAGYGLTTIDLGAPGTGVYSTTAGGGYGYKTGTSMATPHVAGAVAFMYSVAAEGVIGMAKQDPDSVATLILQAILDGTDPITSLYGITVTGGRLNLHNSALLVQSISAGTAIAHAPLKDTRDTLNAYEVVCQITSDTTLVTDSLLLHYDIDATPATVTLTPGVNPEEFVGYIPPQSPGAFISYYLTALDESGEADTAGVHYFKVIDYSIAVSPNELTKEGLVDDTVWFEYVAQNTGNLPDELTLTLITSQWSTSIWDSLRTGTINSTGFLQPDQTYPFNVAVAIPPSDYGETRTSQIEIASVGDAIHRDTVTAVTVSGGEAVAIPFTDSFPDFTVDTSRWVKIVHATNALTASNPPSPPRALNLNGNPFGADTVISKAVDLEGTNNTLLVFSYQRTGLGESPEVGDDLFVEYLDSTGNWQIIAQYPGDGPDMTNFEEVRLELPPDARHRQFRLRLRNFGNAGDFDDWFIDDVYVGDPPSYDLRVTPALASQYGSSGDAVRYGLTITNKGLNSDQYELTAQSTIDWEAVILDSAGVSVISQTNLIAPGDSTNIIVEVAVPPAAETNDFGQSLVIATSFNDSTVQDSSELTTISSGPPGGFPWFASFPEDTLIVLRWPLNSGAEVSTEALNPPSAPYALNLDGPADTITSQTIDLGSQTDVILSYFFQRAISEPPDPGEDLFVEFKNSLGGWVVLDQAPGDGSPMGGFEQRSISLGPDAFHSGFQLRFRSLGSCVNCDNWFIDDIRVDVPPQLQATPLSMEYELDAGDTATSQIVISNIGQGGLSYNIRRVTTSDTLLMSLLDSDQLEPAFRTYPEEFQSYEQSKGDLDQRTGHELLFNAGGPDAYGYFWVDSDQADGPAFDWIDISGIGTNIVDQLGDDTFTGPHQIGFSFPYYESVFDQCYIGSNGLISFSPDDLSTRFKTSIPNDSVPNAMLAWLWDDLNPIDDDNANAAVYFHTDGERCIIQFVDYPEYMAAPGDVITAQVILHSNGTIKYQYLAIDSGFDTEHATIGIESPSGADGLEVAYLTPYLKDSLAVTFINPLQWLTVSQNAGAIDPGLADTLDVTITTQGVDSGTVSADILISNNDPNQNQATIPIILTVIPAPQYICGDVNGDGAEPSVDDLTFLIDYLFRNGPPPPYLEAADMNSSGAAPAVDDITYLVGFLFLGGPPPNCSD